MLLTRIGDVTLVWGESVRWDDRRQRLYFVDCATHALYWLDGGSPPLHTLQLPSLPTGVVLTDGDALVICLDDGLHVVDPDAATIRLLTPYPDRLGRRANDANADGFGHLVTGTLNVTPGPGSLWRFSAQEGWRLLDDDVGNTNGPAAVFFDGEPTLVVGDTIAEAVYAYRYDPTAGAVADRRVLSDHAALGGAPDGATVDTDDGIWSCVLRAGKLARLTETGVDRVVDVPMANPSDLAFGGPDRSRVFVTSIALDLGEGREPVEEASWLVGLDDLGVRGRPEPRFSLTGVDTAR